jgi:hypothetical protein
VRDVVAQTLSQLLLAAVQLPLLAGAGVRALEVADKDSTQICPIVDLAP